MPKLTYRQYLDMLQQDAQQPSALVASNMLAATMAMQWAGGGGELDQQAVSSTAKKLISRPAFKELMADERTAQLMREGKTLELVDLLAQKETSLDRYGRTQEQVKNDAAFLRDAREAMTAAGGAAALERKDRRYTEMMKQIEHAQSLAEKGIPLTGQDAKALVNAVKNYNDGGTKKAGGNKKAEAFQESMCVLKHFMPEREFQEYVDSFNEAHPKRRVNAEMFTNELMTGKKKTARALREECMANLQKGVSAENCAALLAVSNLAEKDPNKLITDKELQDEKTRLLTTGSALNRTLSSDRDRRSIMAAVQTGKPGMVTKVLENRSNAHAIGAAQWRMNRSIGALSEGPLNSHFTSKHLANILVAHEFASKVNPGQKITNNDFKQAVEEMQKDRNFQRFAQRWMDDPSLRQRVTRDMQLDRTGGALALEYNRMNRPARQRDEQAAQQQQSAQVQEEERVNEYYASQYLSNIIVNRNLARRSRDPNFRPDAKTYVSAMEQVQNDRDFKRLVHQYSTDAAFRGRVDRGLQRDPSGATLQDELENINRAPVRQPNQPEQPERPQREMEPPQRQFEQPQPVPQR